MLFKEILEQQPTKRASNQKLSKGRQTQRKALGKQCDKRNGMQKTRQSSGMKRSSYTGQLASKSSKGAINPKKSGNSAQKTKFDSNIPSSTPVFTPIKKDKLPPSITSSQCSLIDLLQQYNGSTINKPSFRKDEAEIERTLVNEQSHSIAIEETFIDPQVLTFKEVLRKLLRVVDASSGSENALRQAYDDVQSAFKSLPVCEKSPADENGSIKKLDSHGSVNLEELQIENISLQRKLRLARKEVEVQENKSQSADISLEMMTIQCQNKALEQRVSELTASLEQALCLQQSIVDASNKLSFENERLQNELSQKKDELARSGDMFSHETKEIKRDVGDALQKVECLKLSVKETNSVNQELIKQIEEKDKEVLRLTELNKGLQGSVSRLLEDLKNVKRPFESADVKSVVLQKLDQFLSSPTSKPRVTNTSILKPSFDSRIHKATNPTVVPNTSPQQTRFLPYGDQSSRSADEKILDTDVSNSSVKSVVGTLITPSLPTTNSVSSSMWSITSNDERNFDVGLASLDADIQRLQKNLQGFNV